MADLGDVLGSPVWTVLATVLAAAAIGVSVWLSRRNKTRKDLSREINVTELVSVHSAADDAKGRIKIYFDEEQIERVHLVEATFKNIGNVPVEADDFDQPITVELGEGASPLTVDVIETTPSDLRAEAAACDTGAVLAPLLLNPGDSLTLKLLARNLRQEPVCHYRIVGIVEMTDAAAQRQGQRSTFRRVRDFTVTWATVGLVGVLIAQGALSFLDDGSNDGGDSAAKRYACYQLVQESQVKLVEERRKYFRERAEGKSPSRARLRDKAMSQAIREVC